MVAGITGLEQALDLSAAQRTEGKNTAIIFDFLTARRVIYQETGHIVNSPKQIGEIELENLAQTLAQRDYSQFCNMTQIGEPVNTVVYNIRHPTEKLGLVSEDSEQLIPANNEVYISAPKGFRINGKSHKTPIKRVFSLTNQRNINEFFEIMKEYGYNQEEVEDIYQHLNISNINSAQEGMISRVAKNYWSWLKRDPFIHGFESLLVSSLLYSFLNLQCPSNNKPISPPRGFNAVPERIEQPSVIDGVMDEKGTIYRMPVVIPSNKQQESILV